MRAQLWPTSSPTASGTSPTPSSTSRSTITTRPPLTQTPEQLRKKLAGLANEAVGIDAADFLDQVTVGKGNGGNKTTTDLKLAIRCACRLLRGELAHEKAQMDDRTRSTSLPPSSSTG
jgi:hypothetical protein